MKTFVSTLVLALSGALIGQQSPALQDYRRQLDLMANQPDPSTVADPEAFLKAGEALLSASPADVKAVLPSARLCLRSGLAAVRLNGALVFFSVAIRMDSAGLLADYIADLGELLNGSDRQVWASALFALGTMHPRAPREVIPYIEPHLADEANTDVDFGKLSAALLTAAPNDDHIVGEIIAAARKRGGRVPGAAIGALMAARSTSEAALAFVGEGLNSSDPGIRNAAVCAVGIRPDIMSRYASRLREIAQDAGEGTQTRQVAEENLKVLDQQQAGKAR